MALLTHGSGNIVTTNVFSTPKEGETRSQDSISIAEWTSEGVLLICMADGSSESFMGSAWSQALTNWFIKRRRHTSKDFLSSIKRLIENFDDWKFSLDSATEKIKENQRMGKVIGVVQEMKMRSGSSSTMLGIKLIEGPGSTGRYTLESFAVGDTCWFLVRNGGRSNLNGNEKREVKATATLLGAFPLERSSEFNKRPRLISSIAEQNRNVDSYLRTERMDLLPGDRLFLMTDALAKWFLLRRESGASPWDELSGIVDDDRFEGWINELRRSRQIDNDDVTLVIVSI